MEPKKPRHAQPEPFQTADGRWRVAVQVGHGSREHRVRRYLSGSSEAAVRGKRDEFYRAQAEGQRPPDRRLTIGTYLRRWLDSLTVRERTRDSYRSVIERHVLPRVGGILLAQLGPLDIDSMLVDMVRAKVGAPTRSYALRVLSVALNVAVTRKRLIPYNPALGADRVVVKRRKPIALTDEQARRLMVALEGERLGPLFRLLMTTAMRRGEALALTWKDWDRAAGELRIDATLLYRTRAGFERVEPKTERSRRVIRLSGAAQSALHEQARTQAAERLRHGQNWIDNDLVFTAEQGRVEGNRRVYGGALQGSTVVHALHRICEDAGLPSIRVHDLRHTAATFMGERLQPAVVQAVLGHSTPTMTARYTHAAASSREAAEAIDEVFGARREEVAR